MREWSRGRARARPEGSSGSRRSRPRGPASPDRSAGLSDLAAPGFGAVEELARAGQGRRSASLATEHLCELHDPALTVEAFDLRDRPAVTLPLGDPVVSVGMSGDLREVRDAQHLVAPSERPQVAPDRVGAPTADPRIDLVEHQ